MPYGRIGGGSPGGPNLAVQFNNAGAFGGSPAFTFDPATNQLTLGDGVTAPGVVVPSTDWEISFASPAAGRLRAVAGDPGVASPNLFYSATEDLGILPFGVINETLGTTGFSSLFLGVGPIAAPSFIFEFEARFNPGYLNSTPNVWQATLFQFNGEPMNVVLDAANVTWKWETARNSSYVPLRLRVYTVATLPAGSPGDKAFVSDALAPAFLAPVVGGGAVFAPVFFSAVWTVG